MIHYIGHGAYDERTEDGILILEDPHGGPHEVTGEELSSLLRDERSLRLVAAECVRGRAVITGGSLLGRRLGSRGGRDSGGDRYAVRDHRQRRDHVLRAAVPCSRVRLSGGRRPGPGPQGDLRGGQRHRVRHAGPIPALGRRAALPPGGCPAGRPGAGEEPAPEPEPEEPEAEEDVAEEPEVAEVTAEPARAADPSEDMVSADALMANFRQRLEAGPEDTVDWTGGATFVVCCAARRQRRRRGAQPQQRAACHSRGRQDRATVVRARRGVRGTARPPGPVSPSRSAPSARSSRRPR